MRINTMIKKVKKLANGEAYSLERRYSTFCLPWHMTVFTGKDTLVQEEGRTFTATYNKIVKRLEELKSSEI